LNIRRFTDLNADLHLTLDIAESARGANVDERMPPHSQSHVRVVDAVLYLDLASMEPPLAAIPDRGWVSLDMNALVPPEITPEPTTQTQVAAEAVVTGENVAELVDAFAPSVLDDFLSVTRTGNTFATYLDFGALYAHPDFQALLRERLLVRWQSYGRPDEISDSGLTDLADQMAEIFPEPILLYSLTVDPQTRQVTGVQQWSMWDFLVMVEAAVSHNDITGWSRLAVLMAADFGEINASALITAPENAQPITLDALGATGVLSFLFPLR